MHSVRLEPTKLTLLGTRTTYQATGDAGLTRRLYFGGYCCAFDTPAIRQKTRSESNVSIIRNGVFISTIVFPLTRCCIVRQDRSGERLRCASPYKAIRFCDAAISIFSFAMSTSVSEARDRISVTTANDIEFNVDYFDDSRIRPYRVVTVGASRNVFDFDTSGIVEIMRIGTERYRVSPLPASRRSYLERVPQPQPAERATLCLQSRG